MSFQAYIDNVEAKTGKSAEALKAIAIDKGLADESGLAPGIKATAIVDLLKSEFDRLALAAKNIALLAEHVAGNGRRKLHFDLWSGDVWLAFPEGIGAEVRNLYGG